MNNFRIKQPLLSSELKNRFAAKLTPPLRSAKSPSHHESSTFARQPRPARIIRTPALSTTSPLSRALPAPRPRNTRIGRSRVMHNTDPRKIFRTANSCPKCPNHPAAAPAPTSPEGKARSSLERTRRLEPVVRGSKNEPPHPRLPLRANSNSRRRSLRIRIRHEPLVQRLRSQRPSLKASSKSSAKPTGCSSATRNGCIKSNAVFLTTLGFGRRKP
jgi:hypothetical protein